MGILKSLLVLGFLLILCLALQSQELSLYRLDSFDKGNNEYADFVSLTDSYPFSDHPDSALIDEKYLGYNNFEITGYHVLSASKRGQFLKTLQISESDSLYIFLFASDTVVTFPVDELKLIAHLSQYSHEGAIGQYEYLIGFEFEESMLRQLEVAYESELVFIGNENPFVKGQIKPLLLKRAGDFTVEAGTFNVGQKFIYEAKNMTFHVENIESGGLWGRHVVVIENATMNILFDRNYFDRESSYMNPLSIAGELNEDGIYQWTGAILKGKPAMVVGFLGYSFGCESIDFIGESEPSIWIKCDNRH